jgi:hypothetical protein
VHVIRDGRDVVASHRDRWGYWSAVKAVEKWPRYIRTARLVGERLPDDRYTEVRYEDLVLDTESAMRALVEYLGEPWDEAVLHHDQAPHDVAGRYEQFSGERRRGAADGAAVYRTRVGTGRREIDPLLRTLINVRAGSTLRALGYR